MREARHGGPDDGVWIIEVGIAGLNAARGVALGGHAERRVDGGKTFVREPMAVLAGWSSFNRYQGEQGNFVGDAFAPGVDADFDGRRARASGRGGVQRSGTRL